jgi:ParB-like chromosome segregation protein Spo0J
MTETAERVWTGAAELEPFLRPVADLKTHPDNPRVGDLKQIAKSLGRFGQVRPALLDAADGSTIVAGNHRYLAAVELGWTHFAVVPHEFKTPEEARAYMLADNRLAELGDYDSALLRQELSALAEREAFDGTGYRRSDLDDLMRLQERASDPLPPPPPPLPPAPPPAGDLHEKILMFTPAQREEFAVALRTLMKEYGTEGVTETVLAALREEAERITKEDADG